ncbi:class I SAM-dependent methyltransferase [Sphingomonas parva]|uniref:Class I SAM-dependent methyltransferase n=1 Tax=Sphingomonas parva TaxID=2555898 RepID=A0A4Y8ZSK8_9SPHN|nr:class I SAM-dependent methyltransferase [Sphingomonas parva]TFI59001.1 class I SAM-dependent methyltransferase [Sphingomonas parva]
MADRDYVLGTEDEEIERLGLQHRVWRARMLDGWRRAGIGPAKTVLDVGAGPGWASMDLAELVGPAGQVIALERSRRFLDSLAERAAARRLTNLVTLEQDVTEPFGEEIADAAWCRWLLCFVPEPRRALANIARALKPGGTAIFHEYADYGGWQMMPPSEELDRFRDLVMKSWRDAGGEPDIALHLPLWAQAEGLEVVEIRPLVEIVGRDDFTWQWPASFMRVNSSRLRDLGYATADEAELMATALDRAPEGARLITPLVAEVVVRKPGDRPSG